MEAIPRRRLDFEFDPSKVPLDWCRDDAFLTTHLNALSLLFPEGERFFVEAVKAHADFVKDPALQAAVKGFIGQEAMHGKEHRAFNAMMQAHGFREAPVVEKKLRSFLQGVRKHVFGKKSQLAVTCALEHFTALLAEMLLANPAVQEEMHETVRQLWVWHALEESEHKAVAYDVYAAAGGWWGHRVAIMLVTTAVFFVAVAIVHAQLMKTRGILWKPWKWLAGINHLAIYPGYFTRLLPAYLHYFVPYFHPNQRDTSALLAKYREALFDAEHGTLAAQLRVA